MAKQITQEDASKKVKCSFLLTVELHDKVKQACALRHTTPSFLIRQLIEQGIDPWLDPDKRLGTAELQLSSEGVKLRLDSTLKDAVRIACQLWELDAGILLPMILRDHIAAYINKAREQRDELAKSLTVSESVNDLGVP